jgi:CBS domain-containing protein
MRRLQKTIEEIGWTKQVPKLGKDERVARAFDLMSREAHDCVLIVEGDKLAGIFTSRDFLNRVAAVRGDPQALALGHVMTAAPRTLRPRDGVAFAINWMAVEGFRNVPIVDDDGNVLGVLTIWDVMRHLNHFFDEIDATPRTTSVDDISGVVGMIDLGGG